LRILVGDHLELDGTNGPDTDLLPYEHMQMLGHGGTASVEMVRDIHTGSVYARKVVKNVYSRNMREAKQALLNEVKILKRLVAHHHVVRVHATYIKGRELAMILDPVADGGDLASFLQNYRDQGFSWHKDLTNKENLAQNDILRKAPYCLASALAFIHKQTIRHKDIKPQNILIHRGRVMYTDFGLAYDFGDAGRSTTTGYLQGMTRRYCAPEVIECGSRNSKSDVFSLGCVFIEIYLALADDAEHDQIYRGPYHEAVDSHPNGIPLPCCASFKSRIFALLRAAVPTMMRRDPSLRPSACAVANLIFTDESFNKSPDLCLECSEFSTSVDDNKFLRLLPATT
jgi:serine/threonine protein kinase